MDNDSRAMDERIRAYIEAARRLIDGQYQVELPILPQDELGALGLVLQDLARSLEVRFQETQRLDEITSGINAGLLLDDVLEKIYLEFQNVIPYDRIGLSLIEDDGKTVRARWAKTNQPSVRIQRGYSAALEGSSLQTVLRTGRPRILNDLEEYARDKPESVSTRLVVAEGIRSSLTCPLTVNGVPVGFIFFSSVEPHTYTHLHTGIFMKIAARVAVIIEKGRLVSDIVAQKRAIERQHAELRRLYNLQDEYVRQVAKITAAAAAIEAENFEGLSLEGVTERADALGTLARVFERMATQVYLRERMMREQIEELQVQIDEAARRRQVAEITRSPQFLEVKLKARQFRAQKERGEAED